MLPAPPQIDWLRSALFLDVDGTLLEIQEHPANVQSDEALINALCRVSKILRGALALISGRPIVDLDRIFSPAKFSAAGAHGAEYRWGGNSIVERPARAVPQWAIEEAAEFADTHRGLLLEHKKFVFALHYRMAPELGIHAHRLMDSLLKKTGKEYRLIKGKMVLELLPRLHTKGSAIEELLEKAPFKGRRPVFVGDDVTDEDGFRVSNNLGGVSIYVGDNAETRACYRLGGIAAVRSWIQEIGTPT